MIQNLIFNVFFWKIFFRAYDFFIFVHKFQRTSLLFFLTSDILAGSLKASKNYRKRSLILQSSFAQQTSLILWNSTHLTLKIISSCNTAKSLSDFINFPANMFLFEVRKNICTPSFLDAQNCIPEAFWKRMIVYLYISVRKDLFQRRSKILSDGWWNGGRLNNFLKVSRCLDLVKCFTIFHFNWNCWKFNYFSAFWYFHL